MFKSICYVAILLFAWYYHGQPAEAATSQKSVTQLVALLDDKDMKIRQSAWLALLEDGTDEVVDALTAVLRQPGRENDEQILNLLGAMKNSKAVAVVKIIRDKKNRVREENRAIIESIHTTASIADIIAALERPDQKVRLEAAVALGAIGSTEAVKPLLRVFREAGSAPAPEGVTRQFSMEEKRFMCLNSFGMGDWYYAAQALVQIGTPQAISGVIAVLKTGDADRRAIAASVLGRSLGPPAVEPLINALKDADESVRLCAARSLRSLHVTRAAGALRSLLSDTSEPVRYSAASALALLAPPEGMDMLAAALKSSDTITSADAAETLCLMPTPAALETVLPYLRQKGYHSGSKPLLVLKYYKRDPQAVEPLILMLMEEDKDILDAAVTALGRIRDKRAVKPLIRLLRDSTGTVAGAVVEALGNIGGDGVFEVLSSALNSNDALLRKGAVTGLGNLGDPRATELLISCLDDADPHVFNTAVLALGMLKDWSAIEPLLKILKTKDGRNQTAAATSLARLNDPRGVAVLLEQLKKQPENERYNLLHILGEVGRTEDIPVIENLTQNWGWRIQVAVKHAIAQIRKRTATEGSGGKKL